jgi:hypothetical protein
MARIPLQVASRSLDTGNVVSYPSGSPVGAAIANAGDALQGIAARYKQREEQKASFDARIRENEFTSDLALLEDEAERSAPANGAGIHDSVYGQVSPDTDEAVRPGSFDKLFDAYAQKMPESQRADFLSKRELYRKQGSVRLAGKQYVAEQKYYDVELTKAQNQLTNDIASIDPNDTQTYEAFKQSGLDLINKAPIPDLDKEVRRTNWEANASEALFKAKLAKDPEFAAKARAALGLAPPTKVKAATLSADQGARASQAMAFYIKRGYTKEQAAGIVGNLIAESGLKPSGAVGDGGTAFGIAQWRGERLTRLKRFANANGRHWEDFETQLAFVDMELQNHETSAYAALKNAKTVDEATAAFIGYERPRGWTQGNPRAGHNYRGRLANAAKIAGVDVPDYVESADPTFDAIPLDRRLVLANQADVQVNEIAAAEKSRFTAEYASHKDALELQIVQGQVKDEAIIVNDGLLKDGDKAELIRAVRSANEGANVIQSDLTSLASGSLALDPYASKDKTRADNLYSEAVKRAPDQAGAVAGEIIQQTGVVPQPVVNTIRKGISSANPSDVVQALQLGQKIATMDAAALGRRDGGTEVQKAVDDFSFYVNKLNLDPNEAARRLIENNNPEKQFQRKALEPAAKEFVKSLANEDIAAAFDDSAFAAAPSLGMSAAQELGIKAEFTAIAEDQFYASNGDPEIAKNRAYEEMKRLYGVTSFGGTSAVIKHPPEKFWPKSTLETTQSEGIFDRRAVPTLDYARKQLDADIRALNPDADLSSVQIVTTPETDAMVKRGELPGYGILYKDANGVLQTVPGKLWRPDVSKAVEWQQRNEKQQQDRAVIDAEKQRVQETQQLPYRQQGPDDFLGGNDPAFGAREAAPQPPLQKPDTLKNKLEERKQELFDNAPELQPTPWGAM